MKTYVLTVTAEERGSYKALTTEGIDALPDWAKKLMINNLFDECKIPVHVIGEK